MLTRVAALSLMVATPAVAQTISSDETPSRIVSTDAEPMAKGKFEPTWESLRGREVPEWFRDAKFGIWAHWGPQCEPERGDWYARHMYIPGQWQHESHVRNYGDPSVVGFKDVIHSWKAENWDPSELVKLYKDAGAKYFFAMASHHDNLDLWDSEHHEWNSAAVGPKRDIIAGWKKAAEENDLPFGVSVHAAHAWSWYEPSQNYDGNLTAEDGKGTWWEGLDPSKLYAQSHEPAEDFMDAGSIHRRWTWGNGITQPDAEYCQRFYDRTMDLIEQADPDLLYFDDTALPLWPVSDAGLKIAASYYNGSDDRVLFGKVLADDQKEAITWDIEKGQSPAIEPLPYQTDTCLGQWHYDQGVYERGDYKSAQTVVRMLIDIVSKNGNLLLNVPVKGDGTIDEKERKIVEEIGAWMKSNGEGIYGTRPWKVAGEGPQIENPAPIRAQGFNEGQGPAATAADIRYMQKGDELFAFVLGTPNGNLLLKSLAKSAGHLDREIARVEQLGDGDVSWTFENDGLHITPRGDGDGMPIGFRITVR